MLFKISLCHRSKIIVNQTELKFTQRGGGGGGGGGWVVVLNSSSLLYKSYEKIQGELQNTCNNEKENKKQLPVQRRVKRLIASRRLNLIKVVQFSSVPACRSLSS